MLKAKRMTLSVKEDMKVNKVLVMEEEGQKRGIEGEAVGVKMSLSTIFTVG